MKRDLESALPAPSSNIRNDRLTGKSRQALLVLDGGQLSPASLSHVLAGCVRVAHRLDILLVNPPAAPTTLLRALLLRLEHAGIDYRLTSVEGDLGEALEAYLKRFLGITMILVEDEALLETRMGRPRVTDMRNKGYRFLSYGEWGRG